MNFAIGLLIVIGSVLGGFAAMGGNLVVLWQPFELLIVLGAGIGAYIIANPKSVLKDTLSAIMAMIKGRPYNKDDYLDLFTLLYMLFRAGRNNINKLESDFDRPMESAFFKKFQKVYQNPKNVRFIADYMRLILLGSKNAHELESLIDEEIETIERDLNKVPNALAVMADSLPALGIIAAVLGVIKAMGAITEPPEVLGILIGGALVGTFLGVLLSYGLIGPLGESIRARREQELSYYIAIKASLIAFLNDYPPQICVEYGRKVIEAKVRPEFEEVEKATTTAASSVGLQIQ